jgi:hypothetical protein
MREFAILDLRFAIGDGHSPSPTSHKGISHEKCVRSIPSFLRPRGVTGGILFEIANPKFKI